MNREKNLNIRIQIFACTSLTAIGIRRNGNLKAFVLQITFGNLHEFTQLVNDSTPNIRQYPLTLLRLEKLAL